MALENITVEFERGFSNVGEQAGKTRAHAQFEIAANYTGGGEAFTADLFEMDAIDEIQFEDFDDGTNVFVATLDTTNDKVRVWTDNPGGVEASGDISGNVFKATIWGDALTVTSAAGHPNDPLV